MREVAILGIGQTPVGEHWDLSLRALAADAARAALSDAGLDTVDALVVGNAYGATFSSQSQIAPLAADAAGLRGVEAWAVEAGEASGGAALRAGYLAVASGAADTVMVLGVEKASDTVGTAHTLARSVSLDADYESIHGATLPALAALVMRRYMHEYGVALAAFEPFSINAHANGKLNANAMYRNLLKPGAFGKAPMVADPVTLFDSAPDGDGAAAVILTAADHAPNHGARTIRVTGSAAASDSLALHDRHDLLDLPAVRASTAKALAQAGLKHDALNVLELHDAFTILTVLALEAAGFAERGQGTTLGSAISLTGALPISTFGGLKARGNPLGATGVYQAVEAVLQLRGAAGANQVANASTALIQSIGGLGSTVVTHILQA